MTPDVKCDVCDEYIIGPVSFYENLLVCKECLKILGSKERKETRIREALGFTGVMGASLLCYLLTMYPIFLSLFIIFGGYALLVYIILPLLCKEGAQ